METQPLPLDRIGQRFSIRLHDPAGGYRDVVGHLKTANSLINRKGEEISFDPAQIFIWREIIERPTLAGKGAPLTLRVLELDQICNLTWPATEELENSGWLMRAAGGVTNRANSVLPLEANLEVRRASDREVAIRVINRVYEKPLETLHRLSSLQLAGRNAIEIDQLPIEAEQREVAPNNLPPGISVVTVRGSVAELTIIKLPDNALLEILPY